MKLHCSNCSYQFTPKTGKAPQRCPYCSKEGCLEKAKEMQDLIDEFTSQP